MEKPKEKRAMAKSIAELRSRLGLTQHALALKIGVMPTEIWRWENAKVMPCKLARDRIEAVAKENGCGKPA